MKYIFSWIPAVLIMAVIFYFSSKPAYRSSESSKSIADKLLEVYENISDKRLEEEIRKEKLDSIDFIIRKTAHIAEYALLAAAIAFPLSVRKFKGLSLLLFTMLTSVLYAASDEFHQIFVPGRSAELRDVAIDSTGALLGAILFLAVSRLKADGQAAPAEAEECED